MDNKKHVFTPMEKKMFLEIIKKYKAVVENKNTDGTSLRNKNEVWNKIAAEYNASPYASSQATNKQLRRLWLNLKQRQREALTKERQHRLSTGGGPPISDATIDPDVAEVAPALIVGIDTAMDSDSILDITLQDNMQPEIEEVIVTPLQQAETISDHDYQISETVALSQIVQNEQRRPTGQQFKNSILEKEYKDRQIRANEKHEIEMKILQAQYREAKAKAALAEKMLNAYP